MQLLKDHPSIAVIEGGISISVSELQPSKALCPIDVTESGIEICINDVQFSKAESQIAVIERGILI